MAIIRGKFFTLTPTSKVDIISNPGKRLTFIGAYSPPTIIGGDETTITENNVIYKVHTFTATGILTVTSADNNIASVECLVVAGGGGGGSPGGPNGAAGGGGGAGGFRTGTFNLTSGTYTVSVGAGGASNTNGEDSFIGGSPTGPFIILSNGGGRGGSVPSGSGSTGGSGGGGASGPPGAAGGGGLAIPGQGFPGGGGGQAPTFNPPGGGGGGAGGAGVPGGSGGAGGLGAYTSISGQPVYYAYGAPRGPGNPGPTNSGAGAGFGSSGGSGIIIIRYRIA